MSIKVETFTAVAQWAIYFINDDSSGMEDSETALADAWLESIAPFYPVDIVEDSERFTWSGTLYGTDCSGVTVCDYICHSTE